MTPVHKKGNTGDMNNYRPISLSSVFSKVFEYCCLEQLLSFIEKHCILHRYQHGFRRGLSTTTALADYYGNIVDAVERGESPSGIFCDLSRAFDCVDHERLLQKLYGYGIRGVPFTWIKSYLSNRTQLVRVTGSDVHGMKRTYKSNVSPVNIGVPQGSILGPLLFILYVNDLCTAVDTHITMYADDTSLLVSDGEPIAYQNKANAVVRDMAAWFHDNTLFLNADKTRHLLFHTRQRRSLPNVNVIIDNVAVNREATTSFLGVIFDESLTFKEHCATLVKRINSRCYQMRSLRTVLDINDLVSCYYAFVHSILSYGIVVWGSSSAWIDVFLAQKRVIRCCAGVGSLHSCRGLFRDYRVLPLPCVYIRELVTYVFQRKSDFEMRGSAHSYNIRGSSNLTLPFKHLKLTFNTPDCLGVKLYNLLPNVCREANSLGSFRHGVKDLLIDLCCYTVEEYIQALS